MTESDLQKLIDESDEPLPITVRGNDYAYDGWVIMCGHKLKGEFRVVVEDDFGRCFIHNAGQIRTREKITAPMRVVAVLPDNRGDALVVLEQATALVNRFKR